MLSKVWSMGVSGIDAFPVSVEVDVTSGLPTFNIVGLPDAEVRESKERVISAIKNSGFDFPLKRITVNLGPAEIKKSGTHFDLPISVAVLAASKQISDEGLKRLIDTAFAGELALDGSVKSVAGVLTMLLSMQNGNSKLKEVVIPQDNSIEAGVSDKTVYGVGKLKNLIEFLNGKLELRQCVATGSDECSTEEVGYGDFSEVRGQTLAKRALEIAAAGGHNVLMIGYPGTGKSMLARRFAGILPVMSREEAIEVTRIYSASGVSRGKGFIKNRPFRDPHHTISDIALIGGGTIPKPGEISLSHHGVLFLDELAEFSRSSLEALREPLETSQVTVSRAKGTMVFPAKFTLISAMNPCPCGYAGHNERECVCSPLQVKRYHSRISGPLLDRIDLSVRLGPVKYGEWADKKPGESSESIRKRVIKARNIQSERFKDSNATLNAFMSVREIRQYCTLPEGGGRIFEAAMKKLGLSARSLDKILKISRTIADLQGEENIKNEHIIEAIQYRSTDRTGVAE
jgi:magnesium chelatase family protein